MKFINKLLSKFVNVENGGDNFGVEAGINNGLIVIKNGLSYSDTKAICQDVVRDELCKYKAESLTEAEQRNNDLFEMFAEKLSEKQMTDAQALVEFKNPAMQFDYFEAQKAYIKAGTPELAAILSDILVERVNESSRTLLQIALGESIQVAPKLIPSQMATLALAFVMKHTRRLTVNSHDTFVAFLCDTVLPIFRSDVSQKQSEFQHLNFTGCSQNAAIRNNLSELFLSTYAGLFMKGYLKDDLPNSETGVSLLEAYPQLFTKCLNDNQKWQVNAISSDSLKDTMDNQNINQADRDIIESLFEKNKMAARETEDLIISLVPDMCEVFDYWKNSHISILTLTSVGIVIGAQYAKLITKSEYNLSIWI